MPWSARAQAANGKGSKHIDALRVRVREYKEHLNVARRQARQAARTIRTFEVLPLHSPSPSPSIPRLTSTQTRLISYPHNLRPRTHVWGRNLCGKLNEEHHVEVRLLGSGVLMPEQQCRQEMMYCLTAHLLMHGIELQPHRFSAATASRQRLKKRIAGSAAARA